MVRSFSLLMLLIVAGCSQSASVPGSLPPQTGDAGETGSSAVVLLSAESEDTLPSLKKALEKYRKDEARAKARADTRPSTAVEPEGFTLEVSPLLPNGKPAHLAYLTLWHALEPADAESESDPGRDAISWNDEKHNTRWVRYRSAHPNDGRHGWEGETFRFTELPAGRYRVSAVAYPPKDRKDWRPDPTPHGVSEPIELGDEANKQVSLKVQLGGSAALVIHATDAETGHDLQGLVLRLRSSEGLPIVIGSGSGNYFERTNEQGEVVYNQLRPDKYSVEMLGRRAYLNDFIQYEPLNEVIQVQVTSDQPTQLEIPVSPRHLTAEEIKERFPFYVYGRVTDENGQPLGDVEIRANTGVGTLLGGGRTRTNADGRYRLYFGGGVSMSVSEHAPLGVGTQAAIISAGKSGWYEMNYNRQGDLRMSDAGAKELEESLKQDGKIWGKTSIEQFVLPDAPREVNFTLARAATVEGKLVSNGNWNLENVELSVSSEEIPDRQPIHQSATTDRDGKFQLNDLPPGLEYRFGMRIAGTRASVHSEPFRISTADVHRFVASLDTESEKDGTVTLRLTFLADENRRATRE